MQLELRYKHRNQLEQLIKIEEAKEKTPSISPQIRQLIKKQSQLSEVYYNVVREIRGSQED